MSEERGKSGEVGGSVRMGTRGTVRGREGKCEDRYKRDCKGEDVSEEVER